MDGVVQQNASLWKRRLRRPGRCRSRRRLSDAVAVFKIGPGEVIDMHEKYNSQMRP